MQKKVMEPLSVKSPEGKYTWIHSGLEKSTFKCIRAVE